MRNDKHRLPLIAQEPAQEPIARRTTGAAFSDWLRQTERVQRRPGAGAQVPCGECTACCRASYFVHIAPDETRTLARIPKPLLFPAPGRPPGHMVMGFDSEGRCPMLRDGACSIYDQRPRTCRDYDCRIFAATAIALDGPAQAPIEERARQWRFEYPQERDRTLHAAVRAAATFLRDHRSVFRTPPLPTHPAQLALLAIKIHRLFVKRVSGKEDAQPTTDSAITRAVHRLLAPRPTKAARRWDG